MPRNVLTGRENSSFFLSTRGDVWFGSVLASARNPIGDKIAIATREGKNFSVRKSNENDNESERISL